MKNGVPATNLRECDVPRKDFVMYLRPAGTQRRTLRSYISERSVDEGYIFPRHTLFVSTDGAVCFNHVSVCPIVPSSNVAVLIPKQFMSLEVKLYYSVCITANRYLFSYGRKPKGNRLKSLKLPRFNQLDFEHVKKFISSLPFSSSI